MKKTVNTPRSSAQREKDKRALKRLQRSGYSGKIDLRKAPTRYQLKRIKDIATAARAKREAKKSSPGRSAPVTKTRMSKAALEKAKQPKKLTTYALPFLRKGRKEPEWRRFTYSGLRTFLTEYKDDAEEAREWMSYAVREEWNFKTNAERDVVKREAGVFFSGRRIDHPHGTIKKDIQANRHTKRKGVKTKARKRR